MKTFVPKPSIIQHNWYIINAKGKILGRLATELALRLRGKHKVEYTPHVDIGDYLIVLNANQIILTADKCKNKTYYRHTGYFGGIKQISFEEMMIRFPERIIKIAVKGMLPKGSIGRSMYHRLKVYAGNEHNHAAQKPKFLDI